MAKLARWQQAESPVSRQPRSSSDEQAEIALNSLILRYERRLYEFLLAVLREPDSAEDCLQETFIATYRHLQKGRRANSSWLFRVALDRARDELRRQSRKPVTVSSDIQIAAPEQQHAPEAAAVKQALTRLSHDDRTILYLANVDGRTSSEIGSILGIRSGTARVRVHRAQGRFRAAYEEVKNGYRADNV